MGNTLKNLSREWLPRPDATVKTTLEGMGVVFLPEPEGQGGGKMVRVELPDGWGLWSYNDRGNILGAYLITDAGRPVADIYWMSKSSYDNKCSMDLWMEKTDRIDLTAVTLTETGWFKIKPSVQTEYHRLVNRYYRGQYISGYQDQLDTMYNGILEYEKIHEITGNDRLGYKRLTEKRDMESTAIGMALEFADPFPYTPPTPWITEGREMGE